MPARPDGPKKKLELLAPADDWDSLDAALEAGADAVHFGLTSLNARGRAKNFPPDEFAAAVEKAHQHKARAYLTLSTDVSQREVGQAARITEWARQAGCDAVLVRDPAVLALREHYPELAFHFSRETCATNSADAAAAAALGASRVVLAREMSLREIAAASGSAVQTEVFVQGSPCFCISGRSLLASWIGGGSGNRGRRTSPCQVPWRADETTCTPAMNDLAAVDRLAELARAGVTAVKIEDRLKNAEWVGRAVRLYRRAIDHPDSDPAALRAEAAALDGDSGREPDDTEPDEADAEGASSLRPGMPYDFEMLVQPQGIVCSCSCGGRREEWTIPKTVVRRAQKAIAIGRLLEHLRELTLQDCRLGRASTNDPDFLLVPRAANALIDRISAVLRMARKTPDQLVRVALPEPVQALLEKTEPHPENRLPLGEEADRVRLDAQGVASFLKQVRPEGGVIAEAVVLGRVGRLKEICGELPLSVALPSVFFEEDLGELRRLVRECAEAGVPVEVNSWGGWDLARAAGASMEAGPGLAVLNSVAAAMLARLGMNAVTLSLEADRRQLEAITAQCPVPCSLVVFSRPPLLTSRARLPDELLGEMFADRRGARIVPRRARGLWVYRPEDPFDLRETHNERISVAHLVVDLIGSPDPALDWYDVPEKPFRFNYNRAPS